ncbi:MAG: serine hydrolase, partial [Longimicrobiales bacterium]
LGYNQEQHMRRFTRIVLTLLVLLLPAAGAAAQQGPLRGLDSYIEKAMADWDVPGLGLAIVRNDSVVHAAGYGVREVGRPERVNERTLFAIGSASKAFTAMTLAQLIDEGKASWDDPATKHLPWFQVHDPYVTREMSIRDLLSHRSGLTRGDRLWYATDLSREEIVRRVRFLEPTWSFRSNFGYQNIMYLAAGLVAEQISGRAWDELVRDRIFTPLGMRQSLTSVDPLPGLANVATPHSRFDDTVTPIAYRDIDNIAPAGSINSTAIDMAQWVRLQLSRGMYNGTRIVSEQNLRQMHVPHTIIPIDTAAERLYPETHFRTYGLGWFLEDYRGRKVVQHGGNIDGMSALVALMPEENVGLVILTNMNGSGLPPLLMRRIFDLYLDGAGRDWSAEVLAFTKERREQAAARQRAAEATRAEGTRPSLPLEKYAGTFRDAMYGDVVISHENGKLMANAGPAFIAELEHWHYDTFRATWSDRQLGRTFLTFGLNARGEPQTLTVEGLGEFTRTADSTQRADRGM